MINDYINFLNESLSLKDIAVGDYVIIRKDPENEAYGDFRYVNKICQRIEYKDKNYFRARFIDKNNVEITRSDHFYPVTNKIVFEKISDKYVEDYKNNKIMTINFSNGLNFILRNIKFETKTYFSDVSFFDTGNKNDEITYLPLNKMDVKDPWKDGRQVMRLGRFLKKMNPELKEKNIEKFSNLYKAEMDLLLGLEVEVVQGEDIRYWYLEERYAVGNGKLNNSCMRYEESQRRFDIYCNNPDKIRMAILKDKKDKLLGRALIWRTDKPSGLIYMDRIYTVSDHLDNIFLKFAKHNKFKSYDKGDCEDKMRIDIELDEDDPHPYMDTFKYYYMEEKRLKSYEDESMEYGTDFVEFDDAD